MTVIEIVKKLSELKDLLKNLVSLAGKHGYRHELGGADEVHLDASQIVSGTLDLDRIPTIPWERLTDIPSEFPPSPHTHAWDEITGKPVVYPPEPHTHAWGEITGKPSSYPPSAHTHTWDEITGKPSSYPPSAHTHTRSDIVDFAHTHSWSEITGVPSEYTPTVHGGDKHTIDLVPKLVSDPLNYSAGSLWFRSDVGELRLSPDGSAVKTIYPIRWQDVQGKPFVYPPEPHIHPYTDISISASVWEGLNADKLDGYHADAFKVRVVDSSNVVHTYTPAGVGLIFDVYDYRIQLTDPATGFVVDVIGGGHGYVDRAKVAESVNWEDVQGKPSAYPPEPHTHDISEITVGTGYYLAKTSRSDNLPSWYDIPDKPSEFPPAPHTHTKADITDFSHSHSRSDVVDLFTTPFWGYIPDKPFETLGSEFTVDAGVLTISSVDWSKVSNKPTEYPPEPHTHTRSDITDFFSAPFWENIPDKPSTYPPESHTHSRSEITDFWEAPFWENIPDKPSQYPPSPHTHTRSDITDFFAEPFWENIPDKPSAYPPEAHTHSRSDITDFWSTPFWANIPDKPFSTLGSEFTTSDGELQIASVDWSKVVNKPSTYPPEPHTHTRSEITDLWSEPFWENIPDKPSAYPPEEHTHTRSEITDFFSSPFWTNIPDKPFSSLSSEFTVSSGELQITSIDWSKVINKPSAYPPEPHTHPYTDISIPSGVWSGLNADRLDGYHADAFKVNVVGSDSNTYTRAPAEVGVIFDVYSNSVQLTDPATGVLTAVIGNGYGYVARAKVAESVSWDDIQGKPSAYPPSSHTHPYTDVSIPAGVWEGLNADKLDGYHASDFKVRVVDTDGTTNTLTPGGVGLVFDVYNYCVKLTDPATGVLTTVIGDGYGYVDRAKVAESVSWDNIINKPSVYPPEPHTHSYTDVSIPSGVWTGLNADMVDGHHASEFKVKVIDTDNATNTLTPGEAGLIFDAYDYKIQLTDPATGVLTTVIGGGHGYVDRAKVAESVSWENVTGKPSVYPPEPHTHPYTDISLPSGVWSGLNADKLDGHHASDFMVRVVDSNNTTNTMTPLEAGLIFDVYDYKIQLTDPATGAVTTVIGDGYGYVARAKVAESVSWEDVTGKPSTYPPSPHTHSVSDITDIASYYAKVDLSNVSDSTVLNKVKNVDGAGSGLDADMLDSYHASSFKVKVIGTNNNTYTKTPAEVGLIFDAYDYKVQLTDPYSGSVVTVIGGGYGYVDRAKVAESVNWDDITGKPSTYPPEPHTHSYSDITLPTGVWTGLNADELDGYHATSFKVKVIDSNNAEHTLTPAETGLVFDVYDYRVRVTDPATGVVTTVIGDGYGYVARAKVAESVNWDNITGKPSTYPPEPHTHSYTDISLPSGVWSGLNADMVDGHHASDFMVKVIDSNNTTNTLTPAGAGLIFDVYNYCIQVTDPATGVLSTVIGNGYGYVGRAKVAESVNWDNVTNKPSVYPPEPHTHSPSDISPQGSGSGLDADTVDGKHASDFALVSHTHDITDISFNGNFIPDSDNAYLIGTSSYRIAEVYTVKLSVSSLIEGAPLIDFNLKPKSSGMYSIGDSTYKWKDLWLSGTVYASKLKGACRVVLAFDDTPFTVTSSTSTEVKTFRFFKSSSFGQMNFIGLEVYVSAYVNAGTGYVEIYIDGNLQSTISVTSTSEELYKSYIDLTSLGDGGHTVSIRLKTGSGASNITTQYIIAIGVV